MRECGFAVAVANARAQVKAEAHYVTPNAGGYGAGRDAVEFILEAKGFLIGSLPNISMSAIRSLLRWILAGVGMGISPSTVTAWIFTFPGLRVERGTQSLNLN